jgi:hypothetical protein
MNSEFCLIELTNKKGGSSIIGFQNWIIHNDFGPINGEDNLAPIVPEFSSLKVQVCLPDLAPLVNPISVKFTN